MNWKRIGKALLFPPMVLLILLLFFSTFLMLYGILALGNEHPVTIASYALSFYTLIIWCVRLPAIIRFFKVFKKENKYLSRWFSDVQLRMKVTLTGNVLWNGAYGALQLGLAIYHRSAWFFSLATYYFSLAIMRFFLARHTLRHKPGAQMRQELRHYRSCGWVFLLMNLALTGMMVLMIRDDRMVRHHEITTITMAAYTFTSLTMSIVNVVRYRKYNSPVFSASKAISLAAACVSMLTLESTMLSTFQNEAMTAQTKILFLALSGGAVSAFIIAMAIYMIVTAKQKINALENENGKQ